MCAAASVIACFLFFFLFRFFFDVPASSSPTLGGGPLRFNNGFPKGSRRCGDGCVTGFGGWGRVGEDCELTAGVAASELSPDTTSAGSRHQPRVR